MAVKPLTTDEFLSLADSSLVLDVRSPAEYAHAHIPGAYSLPLFDNEERKIVGTAYKQESREKAIRIGLDFFGPKMRPMVETVEQLLSAASSTTVLVHCWRGGMRSGGVAWLLDLYGFNVYTLMGGYKSFRQEALRQFETQIPIRIIGGYTGSGKTAILQKLERLGESVIDLEAMANHKGSAFGHLGLPPQPAQEMFENLLAMKLRSLHRQPLHRVWIEDESLRIGSLVIPQPFYKQMRSAPCYFLDIPFRERLDYILGDYGRADRDNLVAAVLRIQKRLGGLETKTAINCLIENDLDGAFDILLNYYDKWYLKGLHSREPGTPVITISANGVDPVRNTQLLLNQV